eukprot:5285872-Pyramimonas_sp.AAC.1
MDVVAVRLHAIPRPNRARGESIFPECDPTTRGERAYSQSATQPRVGREHIPGVRPNHAWGESIFPECNPTTRGERAYSQSATQPRVGREHILGVQPNHAWGESIFSECDPSTHLDAGDEANIAKYPQRSNRTRRESVFSECDPITTQSSMPVKLFRWSSQVA